MKRRRLLCAVGVAGSAILAGCGSEPPATTPTLGEDGSAGPPPDCPDELEPLQPSWEVQGSGPLAGFEMTAEPRTLSVGETLTVDLRNVTEGERYTGSRGKHDLQYAGEDGWHSVFGTEDGAAYFSVAHSHEPGGGFRWEIPVSESGLDTGQYKLCSPLDLGVYRFVYWGITTEAEQNGETDADQALGVAFRVVDA